MLIIRIQFALLVSVLTLAIGIPTARAQTNRIVNPEFDNSTQSWWTPGNGRLNIVADSFRGNNACRVTGRNEVWDGMAQTLLGKLDVGKDYHFSCYVKTIGVPTGEMRLEIAQEDDRPDPVYLQIGKALANDQRWTLLQGGFQLESNGPLKSLHFTVNSTDADPTKFDFLLDSVSIVENVWKAEADARIELHRKRNFNLNLVDQAGDVKPDVEVSIKQVRHHFAFGSTLNTAFIDNEDYANFFKQHFNWATTEWYAQWKPTAPSPTTEDFTMADASVDFAEDHGIKLRGHALAWPDSRFRPEWLNNLEGGQVGTALERRISSVVTRYKSRLQHWDVCNEALNYSFFRDTVSPQVEPGMFKQARSLDPDVRLFTNEFGIVDSQLKAQRYREMILSYRRNEAVVGGIGLQSHFAEQGTVSPKAIEIALSELTDLNAEIWFTEFDVFNSDPDERAKGIENFYRYAFSVPEAKGIIMWGFWAGTHWRGANSSIVDDNWELNAAGEKYFKLMRDWTTTGDGTSDVAGEVGFRGFHGDYLVTTTDPETEVKNYHLVSVPPGSGELDVELILDPTPNSLTIYGTEGDDAIEYNIATSNFVLNNHPAAFTLPPDVSIVRFEGRGGTDHLVVKTPKRNGRARILDSELTWVEEDFTVRYTDIETVDVVAQTVNSVATILDSAGDDTYTSYLDASTLTTGNISITARGFLHTYARSRFGNDTATLFGTESVDRISSDLVSATIRRGNRIRRAIQFEQTEVVSIGGNDFATIDLPNGAKTINVLPNQATIAFGSYTQKFTDVPNATLRGIAGNSDTIFLSGSAGNDTLRITSALSLFLGPNYRYRFKGIPHFETAAGPDLGGSDRLLFFDTEGNDTLSAVGDVVSISGPGYSHKLKFFDTTSAFSRSGEDTATESSPNGSINLLGSWE